MNCVNRLVETFLAERVLQNLFSNGDHRLIKLSRSRKGGIWDGYMNF